jgi:hypothetical protein
MSEPVEIAAVWVNKLLKPELQNELKERGQIITGGKPELIARLNEVLLLFF